MVYTKDSFITDVPFFYVGNTIPITHSILIRWDYDFIGPSLPFYPLYSLSIITIFFEYSGCFLSLLLCAYTTTYVLICQYVFGFYFYFFSLFCFAMYFFIIYCFFVIIQTINFLIFFIQNPLHNVQILPLLKLMDTKSYGSFPVIRETLPSSLLKSRFDFIIIILDIEIKTRLRRKSLMKQKKKLSILFFSIIFTFILLFPFTSVSQVSAASSTTPAKVTLRSVNAVAYNKVTVKWKAASNATSYNVYYKESGAAKWIKIKNINSSKTSYTHISSAAYPLTPGKTYYYTVRG